MGETQYLPNNHPPQNQTTWKKENRSILVVNKLGLSWAKLSQNWSFGWDWRIFSTIEMKVFFQWKFIILMKREIYHCYENSSLLSILTLGWKFITVMKNYYLDRNSLCRKHNYFNQNSLWWKSSQRWQFFTVMKNHLCG